MPKVGRLTWHWECASTGGQATRHAGRLWDRDGHHTPWRHLDRTAMLRARIAYDLSTNAWIDRGRPACINWLHDGKGWTYAEQWFSGFGNGHWRVRRKRHSLLSRQRFSSNR